MTSLNSIINRIKQEGNWSLFVDRDGVVNKRIVDDYVKHIDDFSFIKGVQNAFSIFATYFHPIILVTNQQGIGKGLMTEDQLNTIHNYMSAKIGEQGGKINGIYYCGDLANSGSNNRKPEIGMALKAKKDFPTINFSRSLMLGDSYSDMQFGKKAGMTTIFINTDNHQNLNYASIDYVCASLESFAHQLSQS